MTAEKPNTASSETRLARGHARDEARFTASATLVDLPGSYGATLEATKRYLQQARVRSVLAANTEVIAAYLQTGQIIVQRQLEQGWGAKSSAFCPTTCGRRSLDGGVIHTQPAVHEASGACVACRN